ncbi:MAG: hypothetical protein SFW65_09485 [Alphaproteobacteria bacterium]|nr:hypothetical protein [Alphaproteobacteria bacterium]
MKNIVLAAVLALIAVPALAVGPEAFSVDVSRGYAVTAPCSGASCAQQEQARSNWAPRGQQAQQEASASEEPAANQASNRRPSATKASGKSHRARHAGQGTAHSPSAKTPAAGETAPNAQPAAKH